MVRPAIRSQSEHQEVTPSGVSDAYCRAEVPTFSHREVWKWNWEEEDGKGGDRNWLEGS